MIEPIRIGTTASRAAQVADGVAGALIGASRVGGTGVVNTAALAEKVAAAGAANPAQAATLAREVNARLPLADQQRFQADLRSQLAERNLPAASMGGDAAAVAARRELALDVTQIALDVAGLFDPTPVSDGANAVISLFRGDFLGAGLSAVSIIPYIGDAAKLGKLGKWAQTIEKAVDLAKTDSAFAKMAGPALDKLKDAIGGVPKSVLDALPASARETIVKMKSKLDDLGGAVVRELPPLPARMSREVFDALPPISGPGSHVKPSGVNWAQAPNFENWTAKGNKVIANQDGSYTFVRATDQAQVRYSATGFPDFSPHLNHPSGVREVPVAQTGNNTADFRAANEAAGHPEWGSRPPSGYTWHHREDGTTMQLVPRAIHDKTIGGFGHRGGASVVGGGN